MKEQVLEILGKVNKDLLTYTGENMVADGILDSFELLDMISKIEDAFDIEIDADYVTVEHFANKDTIIALVEELVEE